MNLYGAHFEYAGQSSTEYGLIVASIEESQNLAISGSGAELITLFNKRNDRRYYIDTEFEKAFLEYDMEVFSEEPLSIANQRAITKWLFYQRGFKKLYVTVADDCDSESQREIDGVTKRVYVNCILTDPEKIESEDGVHGYKFTVNCDSTTGWLETVTKTFNVGGTSNASSSTITVTTDTDLHEYVYPIVQINVAGDASQSGGRSNILRGTADMIEGTGGWSLGQFRESQPTAGHNIPDNYTRTDGTVEFAYPVTQMLSSGQTISSVFSAHPIGAVTNGVKITYTDAAVGIAQNRVPLRASPVTLSAWVKAPSGTKIELQTHWFAGAGATYSQVFNANGSWQYLSLTKTPSEAVTCSAGYIYLYDANEGDVMYIVAPKLEYGSTATNWEPAEEDPVTGGYSIRLTNMTDIATRYTTFTRIFEGITFRMNGNTNFITSGYYSKFYDRNFPRLLDGDNRIVVEGPVDTITFEWENRSYI